MALLDIPRSDDGSPLDDRGRRIEPGVNVVVLWVGYGATHWMGQGVARVVAVHRTRAEIVHPYANGTYRVHMAALRIIPERSAQ